MSPPEVDNDDDDDDEKTFARGEGEAVDDVLLFTDDVNDANGDCESEPDVKENLMEENDVGSDDEEEEEEEGVEDVGGAFGLEA